MKVLHVYRTYLPDSYGGIEQAIFQLCLGTTRRGVENHIVYLSDRRRVKIEQRPEGKVYRLPKDFEIASTGISSSLLRHFKLIADRVDIINYHFPWPFGDVLHLLTASAKPAVITYHSDIIRQKKLAYLYRPLMKWFLSNVRSIIATSPNYFATSSILKRYQEKVRIIPIGLDEKSYPDVSAERVDYFQNIVGRDFFLFIGVLRYYKGLHILLDAIRSTNLPVVIVGAGLIEKELKAKAKREGISNVHFFGYLPDEDKVALLSLCKALVFPSHMRAEAFGVSLLEGAMFGKPLISCDIGTGCSYINLDGVTGLVVAPGDAKALRNAMIWMKTHPDACEKMGGNARERFEQLFTADITTPQYMELYSEVLNKAGLAPAKNQTELEQNA
ncbi:MAG TPA: glycosyltransferase [Dissulfurispiraceae bacterium]|nr:glycosyltransferase [Dissulfurispiraceae bacterium]